MSGILKWPYRIFAWVIMSPFLPFAVLLNEIEKFGKYIQWGKIDLEEAYRLGVKRGVDEGTRHFEYALNELARQLPEYKQELVDKYAGNITVVAEEPCTWDLETGKVVGHKQTVSLPSFGVRMEIKPKNKYINLLSRSEIQATIRMRNLR